MEDHILLAHGSGGILTHELIRDVFARYFANPYLDDLGDAALVGELPPGRVALTTDSYVVQPLFFPGGDIGALAVCGTVNDLAVAGARPLYLTAGFILEEGLPLETLERVVVSMAETARTAGVVIVAGDTKVVDHGAADGLFINTAGMGVIPPGVDLSPAYLQPGDALLINGPVGDHGLAVMLQREGMGFGSTLKSDTAPLHGLITALLDAIPGQVRCLRDATRGGLATVLNEWVTSSASGGPGIEIEEAAIPVREEVRAACEFLGLDPLYAANEGKVVVAVAAEAVEAALSALRAQPLGQDAALIGHITSEHVGRVVLRTPYGARRILPMLTGAQLPRIC
ncbi:MAG TPA: hydrogenase expression/formation protein HypE [Anaerolineae bacterium]|nr:hydrogenase expression/formation protein HypE [Anaerolineae bacterium]HQH38782.1 hydrogenase expression/formation protein HypE [Anaerolineae bacterium]